MRVLKSRLVACIGVTALLYAMQNLGNVSEIREAQRAASGTLPIFNWIAFGVVVLFQFLIAAVGLQGGWKLFAARHGTPEQFKEAKTLAVWTGALSLLVWFVLFFMTGGGLFQWGSESGEVAMAKAFALGSTSALTILFVWGTTD